MNQKDWNLGSSWSAGADQYASYVESFTTQAVTQLVKKTDAISPYGDASTTRVLDDGCGSGSISSALSSLHPETPILATDLAERMVEIVAEKRLPNVRTKVADALDLSTLGEDGKDDTYSHVLSSFMVQFTPDVFKALKEMLRVLKPGGLFGLATWGKIDVSHDLFVRAGLKVDPNWKPDDPYEEDWPRDESRIRDRLTELGFVDVQVQTVRLLYGMDKTWLKTYPIESENPSTDAVLAHWRKTGRLEDFKAEYAKLVDSLEDISGLGADGLLAIARKA